MSLLPKCNYKKEQILGYKVVLAQFIVHLISLLFIFYQAYQDRYFVDFIDSSLTAKKNKTEEINTKNLDINLDFNKSDNTDNSYNTGLDKQKTLIIIYEDYMGLKNNQANIINKVNKKVDIKKNIKLPKKINKKTEEAIAPAIKEQVKPQEIKITELPELKITELKEKPKLDLIKEEEPKKTATVVQEQKQPKIVISNQEQIKTQTQEQPKILITNQKQANIKIVKAEKKPDKLVKTEKLNYISNSDNMLYNNKLYMLSNLRFAIKKQLNNNFNLSYIKKHKNCKICFDLNLEGRPVNIKYKNNLPLIYQVILKNALNKYRFAKKYWGEKDLEFYI